VTKIESKSIFLVTCTRFSRSQLATLCISFDPLSAEHEAVYEKGLSAWTRYVSDLSRHAASPTPTPPGSATGYGWSVFFLFCIFHSCNNKHEVTLPREVYVNGVAMTRQVHRGNTLKFCRRDMHSDGRVRLLLCELRNCVFANMMDVGWKVILYSTGLPGFKVCVGWPLWIVEVFGD
jgi:hypothetical protein